jgi:hypothetical protein
MSWLDDYEPNYNWIPTPLPKQRESTMPSFEEILSRPASENKPPEALPVGTYHCLVDGPPNRGKSSQKQTDFLQFKFKILSAMQDVDAKAAAEQQVVGKFITNDYYITDGATYRCQDMLVDDLGIELSDGSGGEKSLSQLVAEAPGKQVLVKIKHDLSQDGKRKFHRVDSTAHV